VPLDCTGTKLNADCIAYYAAKAGFGKDKETLETAVAIALAESSGRNNAVSPTGCCIGLWQINVEVHPYTKEQMNDPQANANAAWKISNSGTKWSPWTVYNTKAYLMYLPTAKGAASRATASDDGVKESPGDVLLDGLEEEVGGVGDLLAYPEKIRLWLADRANIMRILKVIMGTGLIVVGAVIVARPPIQNAVNTVAKGFKK
jgi:hypothetical protein